MGINKDVFTVRLLSQIFRLLGTFGKQIVTLHKFDSHWEIATKYITKFYLLFLTPSPPEIEPAFARCEHRNRMLCDNETSTSTVFLNLLVE